MFLLKEGGKFNIADWFSIYRILAIPVLITFIVINLPIWFAVFLLISLSTDMIDGYLARKLNLASDRGAQLDSFGDAMTFFVALIGVGYFKWAFILENKMAIGLVFGLYLIQLGLAFWRYGVPSSFHTYMAKTAAFFQGIFMVLLFFFEPQIWLFYIMITLSALETVEEIILIFLLPKWTSNVKGLYWVMRSR